MKNPTFTQSNYTTKCNTSQLVLPLDFSLILKEDDPIFSFNSIMDKVSLLDLEQEAYKLGRNPYDFRMMCKLVSFSYMTGNFSLRDMAYACIHDIRYHVLTGGQTPSHKTIGQFIKYRLGSNIKILFKRIVEILKEEENIDMSVAFIDGTKLQANANKYTFVWKKAVKKYLTRMHSKITKSIEELNDYVLLRYFVEFDTKEVYEPDDIVTIIDWLLNTAKVEKIEFKDKSSKKKDPIQRFYNTFHEYEKKMNEYLEKIEICGERNSYSKTDKDATFMHLKEDHYGGTNLFHAAYNIQIMVSDEYITHAGIFDTPGDTTTFIPMMNSYKEAYGEMPLNPVADAGYGSYDNYMYCIINGINLVQKFNVYSIEKSRRYKNKIFNKDNWYRDEETGDYICPRWKRFKITSERTNKKGEYQRIDQIHSCGDGCIGCSKHGECTKSAQGRKITVNPILEEMREAVRNNLGTEEGKEYKKRRSAEVEGAFGIIKNNWNYDRIHRKGKENVEIEIFWIILGFNLRKYHNKRTQRQRDNKENIS